jgi:hypothetical protein
VGHLLSKRPHRKRRCARLLLASGLILDLLLGKAANPLVSTLTLATATAALTAAGFPWIIRLLLRLR